MTTTRMEIEALKAPSVIAHQFKENKQLLSDIAARLHKQTIPFAMTIARGSSDHAATFGKYLLETRTNIVTASAAPSVCTLYNANLNVKNALVIAISQSGQSPDISEMLKFARKNGAITIAFVNQTDSPVAHHAEYVVPLYAGEEIAVAATKSYLATLSALIQFTAVFSKDNTLTEKLLSLPEKLQSSANMNWQEAIDIFQQQTNTFVIGRGFGFPIAQECALKFKETCNIHAEAFSGAELLHGPFALVQKNFPLLLLGQDDVTLNSMLALGEKIKNIDGKVLLALPAKKAFATEAKKAASILLPLPESLHPICDPLLIVQAFYMMMVRLSVARGLNPDSPSHITKITQTW